MLIGNLLVHLDVAPKAFGITEVRLLRRREVKSGEKVRTDDRGAPVDLIAKASVRIYHQCQYLTESERLRISD